MLPRTYEEDELSLPPRRRLSGGGCMLVLNVRADARRGGRPGPRLQARRNYERTYLSAWVGEREGRPLGGEGRAGGGGR